VNEFLAVVNSLHALKIMQPTSYENIFCPKLLNKLPYELKLIVSRTLPDDK